jgi:hypothetical protein
VRTVHPVALLGDLADVRSGYHFRGNFRLDPDGTHRVVQHKDVDGERRIVPDGLGRVTLGHLATAHLLDVGDVLFYSRGEHPYAALVDTPLPAAVAATYFYVARTGNGAIDPDYLAWYINQRPARDALRAMATGTNVPFVPIADLRTLAVPLPPVETQVKIAAAARLAERKRAIEIELAEKRAALAHVQLLAAARGQ